MTPDDNTIRFKATFDLKGFKDLSDTSKKELGQVGDSVSRLEKKTSAELGKINRDLNETKKHIKALSSAMGISPDHLNQLLNQVRQVNRIESDSARESLSIERNRIAEKRRLHNREVQDEIERSQRIAAARRIAAQNDYMWQKYGLQLPEGVRADTRDQSTRARRTAAYADASLGDAFSTINRITGNDLNLRKTRQEVDKLKDSTQRATKANDGFILSFANMARATIVYQIVSQIEQAIVGLTIAVVAASVKSVQLAGDFEATANSMVVATGSYKNAKSELEAIAEVARNTTGLDLLSAEQGIVRLRNLGFEAQNAQNLIKGLSIQKLISRADETAIDRVVVNLTQLSAGSTRASQDIREIIQAMPSLRAVFEEAFGSLDPKQISSEFERDPDQAVKKLSEAMANATAPAGGFNDAMVKARDAAIQAGRAFGEPIIDPLSDAVRDMTDYIYENKDAFSEWGREIANIVSLLHLLGNGIGALPDGIFGETADQTPSFTGLSSPGFFGAVVDGIQFAGSMSKAYLEKDQAAGRMGLYSLEQEAEIKREEARKRRLEENERKKQLEDLRTFNSSRMSIQDNYYDVAQARLEAFITDTTSQEIDKTRRIADLEQERIRSQINATKNYYDQVIALEGDGSENLAKLQAERAQKLSDLNRQLQVAQIKATSERNRLERQAAEERRRALIEFNEGQLRAVSVWSENINREIENGLESGTTTFEESFAARRAVVETGLDEMLRLERSKLDLRLQDHSLTEQEIINIKQDARTRELELLNRHNQQLIQIEQDALARRKELIRTFAQFYEGVFSRAAGTQDSFFSLIFGEGSNRNQAELTIRTLTETYQTAIKQANNELKQSRLELKSEEVRLQNLNEANRQTSQSINQTNTTIEQAEANLRNLQQNLLILKQYGSGDISGGSGQAYDILTGQIISTDKYNFNAQTGKLTQKNSIYTTGNDNTEAILRVQSQIEQQKKLIADMRNNTTTITSETFIATSKTKEELTGVIKSLEADVAALEIYKDQLDRVTKTFIDFTPTKEGVDQLERSQLENRQASELGILNTKIDAQRKILANTFKQNEVEKETLALIEMLNERQSVGIRHLAEKEEQYRNTADGIREYNESIRNGDEQTRAFIDNQIERDFYQAQTELLIENIRLQYELDNFSVGAADRYENAWLTAQLNVKRQAEETAFAQINAMIAIGDQAEYNAQRSATQIIEYLAQTEGVTEIASKSFTGLIDSVNSGFQGMFNNLFKNFGIFQGYFAELATMITRLITNQIAMRFLNAIFGGSIIGGGGGLFDAAPAVAQGVFGGGGSGSAGNPAAHLFSGVVSGIGGGGSGVNFGNLIASIGGAGLGGLDFGSVFDQDTTSLTTLTENMSQGASASSVQRAGDRAVNTGLSALFSGQGLSGILPALGAAAPLLGLGLGASLGGNSIFGQLAGGLGGLLGGITGMAFAAPSAYAGLIGSLGSGLGLSSGGIATLAGALPIVGLIAAPLLLIGGWLLGRNKRRRQEEQVRNSAILDAEAQMVQIIKDVKAHRYNSGEEAINAGQQVIDSYRQQMSQLKDSKTRRHAMAEITGRLANYMSIIREHAGYLDTAKDYFKELIPEFATGGIVPGQRGAPRLVLAHGGELIVNSNQQTPDVMRAASQAGVPGLRGDAGRGGGSNQPTSLQVEVSLGTETQNKLFVNGAKSEIGYDVIIQQTKKNAKFSDRTESF